MTKNKTYIIFHDADADGWFSREITLKGLKERARLTDADITCIGWDYDGRSPSVFAQIEATDTVYMVDISVPQLMDHPGLVWIDHHKTAIDQFGKKRGYQIDGVAACRLCEQWFNYLFGPMCQPEASRTYLPEKKDFDAFMVSEPEAVRMAGVYDVWDKRDPKYFDRCIDFQFGLRSTKDIDYRRLLHPADTQSNASYDAKDYVVDLLSIGARIRYYAEAQDKSIAKHNSFDLTFEGRTYLACNFSRCNSQSFKSQVKPHHEGLLAFRFNGREFVCSLYHVDHRTEIDHSIIAKKYGGGGHRGACGFRLPQEVGFALLFPKQNMSASVSGV